MKKGFTLIEVMVVIVIVGVLAGVGVPKLFGVIAKAKAAEVPVAAGSYISLQNAYLHENNGIGSWKNIGYGAPGNGQSEYFEYTGCINGTILYAQMEPGMPGWMALNRVNLNSCEIGSAWAVVIDPAGEREIEYRRIISSTDCAVLTSSWGGVGEIAEGKCEATGELHEAGTENKEPDKPESSEGKKEEVESSSDTEENSSAEEDDDDGEDITECSGFTQTKHSDPCSKTAQGWEYVDECGFFVNPGEAKRAKGLTVLGKKHLEDRCSSASSSSSKKSSSSKAGSSGSSVNGSSAVGSSASGSNSGSSVSGGGGGGGGSSGVSSTVSSMAAVNMSNSSSVTSSSSNAYPGYKGYGEPHSYDKDSDICIKGKNDNFCDEWRPKSECERMSKNGKNCEEWKPNPASD